VLSCSLSRDVIPEPSCTHIIPSGVCAIEMYNVCYIFPCLSASNNSKSSNLIFINLLPLSSFCCNGIKIIHEETRISARTVLAWGIPSYESFALLPYYTFGAKTIPVIINHYSLNNILLPIREYSNFIQGNVPAKKKQRRDSRKGAKVWRSSYSVCNFQGRMDDSKEAQCEAKRMTYYN
jgi:hypothetical protein